VDDDVQVRVVSLETMTSAQAMLQAIAAASTRERVLIAASRGEGREMSDEADKLRALADAVDALEHAAVDYALIGGLAVGIHSGVPRATLDVDLAVRSGADRAAITAAMDSRGFRSVGVHPHSINYRHGSGEPVQLAFDPAFDVMIGRAETIQVGAQSVRIVRKDDLIAMKRAAGRPKDRVELEILGALREEIDRGSP